MRFIFVISFILTFCCSREIDVSSFEDEFSKDDSFDPLKGYNRVMTNINDKLYKNLFIPIFKGYDFMVPYEGKKAISNVFDNIFFPIRLVNNLLQGKFNYAREETLRFIANTIVGFGGISDVATNVYKLKKHDEDFGQTLGHYGISSGFPIVLPLIGESNLRDAFGLAGDYLLNPLSYLNVWYAKKSEFMNYAAKGWHSINDNSFDPTLYNKLTKDAIDLYPFIKNAYEQRRNLLIKE